MTMFINLNDQNQTQGENETFKTKDTQISGTSSLGAQEGRKLHKQTETP